MEILQAYTTKQMKSPSAPRPKARRVSKALSANLLPDPFTMSRYKLSPYMGCGHACSYCDGRAEKYYVEGDFERDIVYRENLPNLLERELPRVREYGPVAISSGITDAYQPLEAQLRITRSCAKILQYYRLPVTLLTKSALVLEDMPYWREVNQAAGFLLLVTVTTLDQRVADTFESGASPVRDRLRALEGAAAAGCATGALVMPLMPGISDGIRELRNLYRTLADAGVSCIMPGWLTLRPGRQRNHFLSVLNCWESLDPEVVESPCTHLSHEPRENGLRQRYAQLYGRDLQSGNPLYSYRQEMRQVFRELNREGGIAPMIPHRVYRRMLNPADELYMVMMQMEQWYSQSGLPGPRLEGLRTSLGAYRDWLIGEKKALGSPRGGGVYHDMTALVNRAVQDGSLRRVLGNARLFEYLRGVFQGRELFEPWAAGKGDRS